MPGVIPSRKRAPVAILGFRRRLVARVCALLLAVTLLPVQGVSGAGATPTGPTDPSQPATADGSVRLLVTYAEPVDAEVALAQAGAGASLPAPAPSRVQVLELPDAADAEAVAHRLARRPGVVAVEADVEVTLQLDARWPLENHGQTIAGSVGTRGMDIGAVPAWPMATGEGVVVAVLDSGIDRTHPLLRERLWRNAGEASDGRDSDGNGFVDDLHGWDFVRSSPDLDRTRPGDYHGTHVAGIIAGAAHAPTGFSGVAPGARIMPLTVIDDHGSGWATDVIAALRYATDNGADVINLSFGGTERSTALSTALAEARVPVVVAAGNTGRTHEVRPVYPAAETLANTISVAAIDHRGQLAPFSATSRRTVHLAAPGVEVVSTLPNAMLGALSGTSMAAPYVAGVVALALEARPGATTEELLAAVRRGARPVAGAQETLTGGIARASGTLAALGVAVPVCGTAPRSPFEDVPRPHTHHDGVACLSSTNVTSGVSAVRYGAELPLRRGQVASLVARALGPTGVLPPAPASGRYLDLDGSVHRDNVEVLAGAGIVRVAGDRYDPERTVTRAEFAAMVARAAEHAAGASTREIAVRFADLGGVPERAEIELAAELSLVSGRSVGVFDPASPLRRDQAATMLVRLLDRLYQQGLLDPA